MRIDITKAQVAAVIAMLRDEVEDEQLLLGALEGETDLFEITRQLIDGNEEDEGLKSALAEQIDARRARWERCDHRIKTRRNAIMALMEAARVDKIPLPEATVSLRHIAPKPIVTNPDLLPDEYCTFTRKPNLSQIRADFDANNIPGVGLDNGGPSITVRRK